MPKWHPTTVLSNIDHHDALFTLTVDRDAPFTPGQFVALATEPGADRRSRRAYSIASAPGNPWEFFIVELQQGNLSPQLRALRPGATLYTTDTPKGRFTPEFIPEGTPAVWMIATGAGIAPFRSMLLQGDILRRCERIVLVYCVRDASRLTYATELARLPNVTLIPVLSREAGVLSGRVGQHLRSGALEQEARTALAGSHVMLCGNPAMIDDVRPILIDRGVEQAAIRSERYW